MTDPTANNKREDALPNVVLEADPTLDKAAEQGAQQNQTPAGTDPLEPKAKEPKGPHLRVRGEFLVMKLSIFCKLLQSKGSYICAPSKLKLDQSPPAIKGLTCILCHFIWTHIRY